MSSEENLLWIPDLAESDPYMSPDSYGRNDVFVSAYDAQTTTNSGDAGSNISSNDDSFSAHVNLNLFVYACRCCHLFSNKHGAVHIPQALVLRSADSDGG